MTKEQQRIAIAEACGYSIGAKQNGVWEILKHRRFYTCFSGKRLESATLADGLKCPPDYLNDLNAMNEAEKLVIIPIVGGDFYYELEKIVEIEKGIRLRDRAMTGFSGWLIHATAAQRAEAFLKTLNLWKP